MKVDIFSEKTARILSFIGLLMIVMGAIVFIVFGDWEFSFTLSEEKVGQFGDFVGGVVGTILAFVGVILYYIALTEQRKDIDINRETLLTQVKALDQQIEEFKAQTEELQETRKVYEEQTNLYREQTNYYQQQVKELKIQTKTSSLQHFNSEFYSLLNVFINIKNKCESLINNILETLHKKRQHYKDEEICNNLSWIIKEYTNLYYDNSKSLSIYFKTLYRLLKMIDDSIIESDHKQRYAKTLRSQLSENELLIIYYDYYSVLGEKVKILANKYKLLKHLNLMDKLEIDVNVFKENKVHVLAYLNKLSLLLDSKIKQLQDLETDSKIIINENFNFIDISSNYSIEINDDDFIFGFEFSKEQKTYKKEDLNNLFLMFLYDYFYLSKLKTPQNNIFEKQIIERDNTIKLEYKSGINNII